MGMINGLNLHREMIYHGRKIIIDAARLDSNVIEIIVMDAAASNIELECYRTNDPDEAEKVYSEYRYKYSDQPHATLTGKYKQLKIDLAKALEAAKEADSPEDGGTCNFDAPAIRADRWTESKVIQAAKEAGTTAYKWRPYKSTFYVFGVPGGGQANRRSRKAEAMTESLKAAGYDSIVYSQMD